MFFTGAGILPYTIKNNRFLFLLGENEYKGWKDFGGKREFSINERIVDTAKREFMEETLGSIFTKQELENIDLCCHYNMVVKKDEYYRVYFLYIDYDKYNRCIFLRNRNNAVMKYEQKITDIRWLSCHDLAYIRKINNFRYPNYNDFFKKIYENNS